MIKFLFVRLLLPKLAGLYREYLELADNDPAGVVVVKPHFLIVDMLRACMLDDEPTAYQEVFGAHWKVVWEEVNEPSGLRPASAKNM